MIIKDKNFLVLGLLNSGINSYKLIEKYGGAAYYYDDLVENFDYKRAEDIYSVKNLYCAVKSPGFFNEKVLEALARAGIPIISEIELGFNFCKSPIIAITGTNGKTTTVNLLHEILTQADLKSRLLGNVGTAFTSSADECQISDLAVLEVSSFQLTDIVNFKPHIAAVLNIDSDHLNVHKTFKNYKRAKLNIFKNTGKCEYAVLNFDDKNLKDVRTKSDTFWFSINEPVHRGCYVLNEKIIFINSQTIEPVLTLFDIKLLGKHNLQNVLCAVLCAKLLNVDNETIKRTVSNFSGVKHRLQYVKTVNGVNFYNDSKATNINSTLTAVRAMDKPTALILGGSDKGLDYKELFKNLSKNIRHCFICGATAQILEKAAKATKYSYFTVCKNLNEAVKCAYEYIKKEEGSVLLSPAAASFDSFKNFEERGEFFIGIVNSLK